MRSCIRCVLGNAKDKRFTFPFVTVFDLCEQAYLIVAFRGPEAILVIMGDTAPLHPADLAVPLQGVPGECDVQVPGTTPVKPDHALRQSRQTVVGQP